MTRLYAIRLCTKTALWRVGGTLLNRSRLNSYNLFRLLQSIPSIVKMFLLIPIMGVFPFRDLN